MKYQKILDGGKMDEELSNKWLELMGIDFTKFKILFTNDKFEMASGPMIFAGLLTKEQEQLEITKRHFIELSKECCKICGVHLERDEINSRMRCTVCYFKKDDR